MSIFYHLIAVKPDSSDYCRGCHMASYSSDFKQFVYLTREELIQKWAELASYECQINEAGYGFTVFNSEGMYMGSDDYPEFGFGIDQEDEITEAKMGVATNEFDSIKNELDKKVSIIEAARKTKKEQDEQNYKNFLARQKEDRELREFKRLQQKFEGK